METETHKSLKILIVDPYVGICNALSRMINGEFSPVTCVGAVTASQALDIIFSEPFDLVILDISLHDMDGLDLIKTIRQRNPVLPVIVFSLEDKLVYVNRAFDLGVSGYVSKTKDADEMIAAITQALLGNTYIGKSINKNIS